MEEEKSLTEQVKELKEVLKDIDKKKIKKVRLPARAKVRGNKVKKGYLGCMKVGENGSATFEKVKVDGGAFTTSDGSYHATDGREILLFNGKFPFIVQEEKRINPRNFTFNESEQETYGDKYVLARMLKDAIKLKKGGNMSPIIIIVVIGVILFILGKFVFKLF